MARGRRTLTVKDMAALTAVTAAAIAIPSWNLLFYTPPTGPYAQIYGAFATAWRPILIVVLVIGIGLLPVVFVGWRRLAREETAVRRGFDSRAQLAALTPDQFEAWCANRLREQGYRVTEVGGTSDHGIDLIAERDGQTAVVQCKRYTGRRTVDESQIRDLYGVLSAEKAGRAIAMSAGWFSGAARAWANDKPIELWDVDRLASLGSAEPSAPPPPTASTVASAAALVCPNCGSALVQRRNRQSGDFFYGCSAFPRCRYTRPT